MAELASAIPRRERRGLVMLDFPSRSRSVQSRAHRSFLSLRRMSCWSRTAAHPRAPLSTSFVVRLRAARCSSMRRASSERASASCTSSCQRPKSDWASASATAVAECCHKTLALIERRGWWVMGGGLLVNVDCRRAQLAGSPNQPITHHLLRSMNIMSLRVFGADFRLQPAELLSPNVDHTLLDLKRPTDQ